MNVSLEKSFSVLRNYRILQIQSYKNVRLYSSSTNEKSQIPKSSLKIRPTAMDQPTNGEVYDKKPFKMLLQKDKKYCWCLCGKSHTQPLCDGTHKSIYLKIKHRPIRFEVDETKEYWLCNCKQTKHRPFCDGTHKLPEIQAVNTKV